MDTSLIFDAIAVAVVLLCLAVGAARGAMRAVAGLAATCAGAVAAFRLQGWVAPWLEGLIAPLVRRSVDAAAESQGLTEILEAPLTQNILALFRRLTEALGLTGDLSGAIASGAQATGDRVLDAITAGVTAQIAPVAAFLLIFLVVKAVVSLILRAVPWDRVPLVGSVNRILGAALGLVSGVAIVAALCWGILRFGPADLPGPLSRQAFLSSRVGGLAARVFGEAPGEQAAFVIDVRAANFE
jgi:uncharacterized membrane protein required for colicin V production